MACDWVQIVQLTVRIIIDLWQDPDFQHLLNQWFS